MRNGLDRPSLLAYQSRRRGRTRTALWNPLGICIFQTPTRKKNANHPPIKYTHGNKKKDKKQSIQGPVSCLFETDNASLCDERTTRRGGATEGERSRRLSSKYSRHRYQNIAHRQHHHHCRSPLPPPPCARLSRHVLVAGKSPLPFSEGKRKVTPVRQ